MGLVAPSILSADFLNLGSDVRVMEKAGAQMLHVDVMDGHFVPNLSIGIPVIKELRRSTDLLLDVHLMISNPEEMFSQYISAGADYLSVHYEATNHLDRLVESIRENGAQPGVVLNPHTPISVLDEILPKCHHVLIMSVNPGFGGQEFITSSFNKVRKLKELISSKNLEIKIEIDGGMGPENTQEAVEAGVDIVVAGSAIFGSKSPEKAFHKMQQVVGSST
ncbi:MAG: ribulose-phosphate 3-epimerase [Acidobacteriota bacterium]|nr:ribulose-phosphate 3-epimerase [Acidobacteriota bacterium]